MGKLHEVAERLLNVMRRRNGLPDTALENMLPEHRAEWLEDARAAVETLREPDDGMVDAMSGGSGDDFEGTGEPDRQAWRAAIDAILAEDTNGHR